MTHLDIALFRGRGLLSAAIRWQTASQYSHAAVVLPDGKIIEAWQGEGVRITTLDSVQGVDFFKVWLTSTQRDEVLRFLAGQIGMGYDYLGVLRFLTRFRGAPDNRWFCSELVFAAFLHAGVPLLARTEAHEVSPGMLSRSTLLRLP